MNIKEKTLWDLSLIEVRSRELINKLDTMTACEFEHGYDKEERERLKAALNQVGDV